VVACLEDSIFYCSSSDDEEITEKQKQVYKNPHYLEYVLINDIEQSRYKCVSLISVIKHINSYIKLFGGIGIIDFREKLDDILIAEKEKYRKNFIEEQEAINKPYIHIDSEDEDYYEDDYPKF
jgi:hypothetical protein